jgi:hypothetical protein
MTRQTKYRLYFNNQPATREQLDRVETITVQQEVDMAWEAQLEIPICVDRRGRWIGADEPFMRPYTRVRVEVSLEDDRFVPLIDGPVIDLKSRMQFEPGQSALTLIVRDDSVFLNQIDRQFSFDDGQTDRQIVEEIFSEIEQIGRPVEIDKDLDESGQESSSFRGNGTAVQVLRDLAKVRDKHVYVLPGPEAGERSIGCFKAFPVPGDRQESSLPTMILLGSEANIRSLDLRRNIAQPAGAFSSTVRLSDKSIVTSRPRYRDMNREILGERTALPEGEEPSRMLRPNPFVDRQRDRAVDSLVQRSSYAFEVSGSVIGSCYRGVLQPYRLVTVQAGETPQSGKYVIVSVTHTFNRSTYSQDFRLTRDAESDIDVGAQANAAAGAF